MLCNKAARDQITHVNLHLLQNAVHFWATSSFASLHIVLWWSGMWGVSHLFSPPNHRTNQKPALLHGPSVSPACFMVCFWMYWACSWITGIGLPRCILMNRIPTVHTQQHALPVTAQTNRLVQDPTCLQSPWRRRQIEPCSGLRDSADDARAPHSAQRHPAERLMRSSSKHYSILAAICLNTLIWAWNGKAHCDRYEDTDAVTSLAWVWLCCVWTLKPSHVLSGRRDVMPGLV